MRYILYGIHPVKIYERAGFKFDPSQLGLRKTLREYEELALRCLWEIYEEGAGSGLICARIEIKHNIKGESNLVVIQRAHSIREN